MTVDVKQFGKVAVLLGGVSAEREVSLNSGQAVLSALLRQGVDAHGVDLTHDTAMAFAENEFDRAFVVLHGRWGEDGVVQGFLETLNIPYTGSRVMGSAIAMDKVRSKQIWQALGLPTADFKVVESEADFESVVEALGLPLFMKPAREGSSVGVGRIDTKEQMLDVWKHTAKFGDDVIAEEYISGDELTVSILHGKALPIIRMTPANQFYDYEAKYQSDETKYECPAPLSDQLTKQIQRLAEQAFASIGCYGWGRVDVMLDSDSQPLLLEVNTVPGMTDHSLVPMAANAKGMSFDALCLEILAMTLDEKRLKQEVRT